MTTQRGQNSRSEHPACPGTDTLTPRVRGSELIPSQTHHQASVDLHRLQMWLREHHPFGIVPPTGVSKKNTELCLTPGDTVNAAARSSHQPLPLGMSPDARALHVCPATLTVLAATEDRPPDMPAPPTASRVLLMRGRETLSKS